MQQSHKPNLFPIAQDVLAEALDTFHRLDNDELSILVAANSVLLPEDNPTRFVLDLHLRPDLMDGSTEVDELRRHTYKVSVLLGRHIVKHSIEIDEGYDSVRMTAAQRVTITDGTKNNKTYTPRIERIATDFTDSVRAEKPLEVTGLYPYLNPEDEAMQDALMMQWHNDGLSFLRAEATKQHIDDELPNGMKDLFRTYALLDEDPDKNWHLKKPGLRVLS